MQEVSCGKVLYALGSNLLNFPERDKEKPLREAIIAAKYADVVVLCMGINPSCEGEESDAANSANNGDRDTIQFPETQKELMEAVVAVGKPTIFVNVSGSCMNLDFAKNNCNAVIQCFYPGQEGGNALADVIFGKVSPSGRLPVTFYRSDDDLPPFEDYSMEGRTYKFFKGEPMYRFGYGLTYADISEEWIDDNTALITNCGGMDTGYSVLKYENGALVDFKKIFIKVGESITVKF
jgi:beta-glucosidase